MRVGIVTTWFDRGAANVSRQIMNAIKDSADVYIYARGEKYAKGDSYWDLPNVHWGRRLYWAGSGKIDRGDFERWINDKRIETLVFNEQRWWQPIIWAKEMGVKIGAYIDYYTNEDINNFSIFDFVICNTQRHFSAFCWHPGAVYVPWGTQTNLYRPQDKSNKVFTFFHSCGWDPYRKGLDILINAFDRIKEDIDAELLIHTQCDISDLIVCDSKIRVIKQTLPPPGMFTEGDVYVYPSRLEGIGLTIVEALSCGRPVITTDEPPMSEFVQNGVTGYLIPVKRSFKRQDGYYWNMVEADVDKLAELMLTMYSMDSERLNEMKNSSRHYALESRDWLVQSKKIFSVIMESDYTPINKEMVEVINKYDYSGKSKKLDYLIRFKPSRFLISKVFEMYRKLKQPHLYR